MALDPNRWTVKTQEAFNAALDAARDANHPEVTPRPPARRPAEPDDGVVVPAAAQGRRRPVDAAHRVDERAGRQPKAYGAEAGMSRALRDAARAGRPGSATDLRDEYLSTEHLLLAMADRRRRRASRSCCRRSRRCGAATASPPRTRRTVPGPREVRPRPHRGGPRRASSTRSSAATRRSAASSRCCRAAPRTTRCSSASPASARPPSSRASPGASSRATCPRG